MKRKPIVLTASSLSCLFSCARKYYLSYVIGWRKKQTDAALRFGTAYHKGLESWFESNGDREKAINDAFMTAGQEAFDAETAQQLTALLVGYFERWGSEPFTVEPEREFAVKFPFLRGVVVCGKMDGIVTFNDGRKSLIEHKTTGEDIGPLADYWQGINRDQVAMYRAAAEKDGIPLLSVIYDVIRKPTIRCGKDESAEDYGRRLAADCIGQQSGDNPRAKDYKRGADFYFARREIPILECDMESLARRMFTAKTLIKAYRKLADTFAKDGAPEIDAWPKCGSTMVCRFCAFRGVCHTSDLPEDSWEKGRMYEELTVAKKYL